MFLFFSLLFILLFMFLLFWGIYFINFSSLIIEFFFPLSIYSELSFSFSLDFISLFFFSSVSLISCVVFLYSKFYMSDSIFYNSDSARFFYLLFFFVLSMFFLVFSNSWVCVMLGWDGLGLVSFLLVIYYNNNSSVDSGLITVFTNRLGDCFFILSFSFMLYSGWFNYDFLGFFTSFLFTLIMGLGCMTKSAQFPFSSWLPAAMAAPTPVSSLVHSSTLVTAGVYLMIRFNVLFFSMWPLLTFLSLVTMVVAGVCASIELDFKKVVAMSTLSQLGFMVFSISLGFWELSFFHMMFHAFFKSSLFLSTGSLMHLFYGQQDSRYFSTLGVSYFSKLFFIASSLSLMGFPFSLGFYSKDAILSCLLYFNSSMFSLLFLLGCCFTVSYSFRLVSMAFSCFPIFDTFLEFIDDWYFFLPLLSLFLFYVFSGNFFFYYFFSFFTFSFFDFFMGGIIIILGSLFFKYLYLYKYAKMVFFSLISFLSVLSSSYLSHKQQFLYFFMMDSSWGEIAGANGVFHTMEILKFLFFQLSTMKIMTCMMFLFFFYLLYI